MATATYADAVQEDSGAARNFVDLEFAYYRANGATADDLAEAERQFLVAKLVTRSDDLYDMWKEFITGPIATALTLFHGSPPPTDTIENMKRYWWMASTPLPI